MFFIGDVHGEFDRYRAICEGTKESTFQIGDMGMGFEIPEVGITRPPDMPTKDKWMHGNHDNPLMSLKHPNNLGRFGYDEHTDIFWIAGGFSIDREQRVLDKSWWSLEQLTIEEMIAVKVMYKKVKPRILVSHEPCNLVKSSSLQMSQSGYPRVFFPSDTEALIDELLTIHRPEFCISGHMHTLVSFDHHGTFFVGLDELIDGEDDKVVFRLEGIEWKT